MDGSSLDRPSIRHSPLTVHLNLFISWTLEVLCTTYAAPTQRSPTNFSRSVLLFLFISSSLGFSDRCAVLILRRHAHSLPLARYSQVSISGADHSLFCKTVTALYCLPSTTSTRQSVALQWRKRTILIFPQHPSSHSATTTLKTKPSSVRPRSGHRTWRLWKDVKSYQTMRSHKHIRIWRRGKSLKSRLSQQMASLLPTYPHPLHYRLPRSVGKIQKPSVRLPIFQPPCYEPLPTLVLSCNSHFSSHQQEPDIHTSSTSVIWPRETYRRKDQTVNSIHRQSVYTLLRSSY